MTTRQALAEARVDPQQSERWRKLAVLCERVWRRHLQELNEQQERGQG